MFALYFPVLKLYLLKLFVELNVMLSVLWTQFLPMKLQFYCGRFQASTLLPKKFNFTLNFCFFFRKLNNFHKQLRSFPMKLDNFNLKLGLYLRNWYKFIWNWKFSLKIANPSTNFYFQKHICWVLKRLPTFKILVHLKKFVSRHCKNVC